MDIKLRSVNKYGIFFEVGEKTYVVGHLAQLNEYSDAMAANKAPIFDKPPKYWFYDYDMLIKHVKDVITIREEISKKILKQKTAGKNFCQITCSNPRNTSQEGLEAYAEVIEEYSEEAGYSVNKLVYFNRFNGALFESHLYTISWK